MTARSRAALSLLFLVLGLGSAFHPTLRSTFRMMQTDPGDTRLVNVHVQRLRAKVERDAEHPDIVVTVRGVGYKAGPT